MESPRWYFPKSIEEAADLVNQPRTRLHSGGTGLLMGDLRGTDNLVDLSHLPLHSFNVSKDFVEIGSMNSYADVVSAFKPIAPENILVKSLCRSANTPLRNRITLGGSLAFSPPWSDLLGALVALDATVQLDGEIQDSVGINEYLRKRQLRKKTLIKSVQFKLSGWKSFYYREIRTENDFPAYTITVLLQIERNIVTDSRIVVVGTEKKYSRLLTIEDYLKNRNTGKIRSDEIIPLVSLKIPSSRMTDSSYAQYRVAVELSRGIEHLIKEN